MIVSGADFIPLPFLYPVFVLRLKSLPLYDKLICKSMRG